MMTAMNSPYRHLGPLVLVAVSLVSWELVQADDQGGRPVEAFLAVPKSEGESKNAEARIHFVLFTPDSTQLLGTGRKNGDPEFFVNFWNVPSRALTRSHPHPSLIMAASLLGDGKRLVTGGTDCKIRVLSLDNWQIKETVPHEPSNRWPRKLVALPDGKRFVSASSGYHGCRMWALDGRDSQALKGEHELIGDLAVSADGLSMVVVYLGGTAELWSLNEHQIVGRLRLEKGEGVFLNAAFSPNGEWIATGCTGPATGPNSPFVILWDRKSLKKRHECRAPAMTRPYPIAFSNDSKLVIATSGDELNEPAKTYIWDTDSGKLVYSFTPWKHGCREQALSPDNQWLVVCGVDGTIHWWNFATIRRNLPK